MSGAVWEIELRVNIYQVPKPSWYIYDATPTPKAPGTPWKKRQKDSKRRRTRMPAARQHLLDVMVRLHS